MDKNRRTDKRLHLPDLQIKVRSVGIVGDKYVDCTPVDVSLNGLAFSSTELELELLQKVDVQLFVNHKVLEGTAVVCHIKEMGEQIRYGVLYIDIRPSIEDTFSLDSLSSTVVKDLAINMADNAVITSCHNDMDVMLRKAQMILFDAIEAFKVRLCDLVDDTYEEDGSIYKLSDLFGFDPNSLSVTIPLKDADKKTIVRRAISPVISTTKNSVVFEGDDGRQYGSILDILQELSDTFQWILADKS